MFCVYAQEELRAGRKATARMGNKIAKSCLGAEAAQRRANVGDSCGGERPNTNSEQVSFTHIVDA